MYVCGVYNVNRIMLFLYEALINVCMCVSLLWVLFLIFSSPPTGGVIDVLLS